MSVEARVLAGEDDAMDESYLGPDVTAEQFESLAAHLADYWLRRGARLLGDD